jgi:hypothetical protein
MTAIIIGISSGLLIIWTIKFLRYLDKQIIYGLILSAIGFLYVGFCWTDVFSLIVCSVQSVLFLLIAYYGMKKSLLLLAGGYFLHGIWDLAFDLISSSRLIPPHYDLFCLSIDFTTGFYLIVLYRKNEKSISV